MEFLEQLILLAVLGVVAGVVFFLLRQGQREIDLSTSTADAPSPPVADAPALPIVVQPVAIDKSTSRKRKRRVVENPSLTLPARSETSPIANVLAMLKEKNALTTAFILQEILGPPLAKRR